MELREQIWVEVAWSKVRVLVYPHRGRGKSEDGRVHVSGTVIGTPEGDAAHNVLDGGDSVHQLDRELKGVVTVRG
jgi:hypothetical protein